MILENMKKKKLKENHEIKPIDSNLGNDTIIMLNWIEWANNSINMYFSSLFLSNIK